MHINKKTSIFSPWNIFVLHVMVVLGFADEYALINNKYETIDVRIDSSIASKTVAQIKRKEVFRVQPNKTEWWEVKGDSGRIGFIHSTHVKFVNELSFEEHSTLFGEDWQVNIHESNWGKGVVRFFEAKRINGTPKGPPYDCSAYFEYANKKHFYGRRIYFDIEVLGWKHGLKEVDLGSDNSYRFFVKYGDYDSRTIIISKDGKFADIGGGSFVPYGSFIISEYFQDCCRIPLVFNLESWKVTHNVEDFVYEDGGRNEPIFSYFSEKSKFLMKIHYERTKRDLWYILNEKTGKFEKTLISKEPKKKIHLVPKI